MNHDYGHCQNGLCPLHQSCHRYTLYLEDKKGNSPGWCSYSSFKPDKKGECEHYIPENWKEEE